MARYLIMKRAEPEEYGGAEYAASLPVLAGEERPVFEIEGEAASLVKAREIPDEVLSEQLEELRSERRPHIRLVEPDHMAEVPPAEIGEERARNITTSRAEELAGIKGLKDAGLAGKGAEITIHDTGIHPVLLSRYQTNVASMKSYVEGEDALDTTNLHGSWIFSVLRAAAPEAKFHIRKVLSSKTGQGSFSGLLESVANDNAHVANSSLSGPKSRIVNTAYADAASRGVIQGVAAGNDQEGTDELTADLLSPATCLSALTVGAKRSDGLTASFSSWGDCVDYSAPGRYVECADPDVVPGFYSGTSMSVYGVAAAAILRGAGFGRHDVERALLTTARDSAEPEHKEGVGMVDGLAAYQMLKEESREDDPMKNLIVISGRGEEVGYSVHFSGTARYTERAGASVQGNDVVTRLADGSSIATGTVSTGKDAIEYEGRVLSKSSSGGAVTFAEHVSEE